MQGSIANEEHKGRNSGTSEAASLTALKVRGCDLAPRFADLIEATGHVPHAKAVHMNAPSPCVKTIAKPLAPRAVPHLRLYRLDNEPVKRWAQTADPPTKEKFDATQINN